MASLLARDLGDSFAKPGCAHASGIWPQFSCQLNVLGFEHCSLHHKAPGPADKHTFLKQEVAEQREQSSSCSMRLLVQKGLLNMECQRKSLGTCGLKERVLADPIIDKHGSSGWAQAEWLEECRGERKSTSSRSTLMALMVVDLLPMIGR